MARLNVNPTRMELTRLKTRLKTARRGHKLLKDKRDELVRQFLEIIQKNRELRVMVERDLGDAHSSFTVASALMSPEILEAAIMYPKISVELEVSVRNIMSVDVPEYEFDREKRKTSDIFPYSYATTSGELDDALMSLNRSLEQMIELARLEKTVQLLAFEIEKTRRRVNALEYVLIPQIEETIRYITMKLEENERGNLTRLMKVKDMMVKQQIEANALRE